LHRYGSFKDGPVPMPKLRVAIVAPSLRILGGQAVQADRLLREWKDDPDVDARLVPHNPLPPRPLRFAIRVKYLRTLVTELTYVPLLVRETARADVVHVFSASYSSFLLAPLPAIVVALALGRPVVLHYHSGEAPDHLARSAVARAALARTSRNIVPSQFLADVFASFGLHAGIVPNLIDLARFQFRERKPLRPRLLSTRNLEPLYNVACTLRAFRIVQERRPDAILTVVGGGREDARLRGLARDLHLNNVTFAGRVSPGDIAEYYAAHDIYVQSPDIDNMPVSVLEAYASGLPVVSTDVGGIPAILTNGRHGLLAPGNDHEGLAAHILRLLDDPATATRLAGNAFDSCQSSTWGALRHLWLDVYRDVVRDQPRAASAFRPTCPPFERLGAADFVDGRLRRDSGSRETTPHET
jgi:L-malate glycosyltransferase